MVKSVSWPNAVSRKLPADSAEAVTPQFCKSSSRVGFREEVTQATSSSSDTVDLNLDLKCYILDCQFETLLLLSLLNDSTAPKSRPLSQEVFLVYLRLFFADVKYYINLIKENVLKARKIRGNSKQLQVEQLQLYSSKYIVVKQNRRYIYFTQTHTHPSYHMPGIKPHDLPTSCHLILGITI